MKRISIDPVTRLEGHGKIDIFLNDEGDVENVYLQIPELRGFEQFCVGRPAEDMPNLTARICGVCPEAHHMAATKALDALFHVDPPPAAKKLRELFYSIFYATDHTTHFYALGGPDFVVGPTAPAAERNILGVVKKVGMDIAGKVLKMRRDGHHLIQMIGGRKVHPNWGLPGGVSRGINEEQRQEIEGLGREAVEFARFSLKLFEDVVLKNSEYVKLVTGDTYLHRTYNMGMVDANNCTNFYDGQIRVVGPDGARTCQVRREGLPRVHRRAGRAVDLPEVPLPEEGRLERARRRPGKRRVQGHAAVALQRRRRYGDALGPGRVPEVLRRCLGGKPVHHTLATHWARLIELLYAAEHWVELATDPQITSKEYRILPTATPTEGVGCVEAPRGTLTHHYTSDERGILTQGEPGRRHDEQQRPHLHVGEEGRADLDRQRPRRKRGAVEHGGNGISGLRSVLWLRHAQLARPDAVGGDAAGSAGAGRRALSQFL